MRWVEPCVALLCAACAGAQTREATPERTMTTFARALIEHRYEEAYGLMSSDYRARVPLAEFKSKLEANEEEASAMADRLLRAEGPSEQRATIRYDDDQQLELEREGDAWLVTTNVAGFYDQSTPRAALRAFIRAMDRRRYDVVLRLVPNADKEGITAERMQEAWSGEGREEAERLIHNLREHADAPIEIVGDRATMPYGDRMRVQFLREDGRWKIEDPE